MAVVVRALLWGIVVLAPGGLILLPFLAVRALRRNKHATSH